MPARKRAIEEVDSDDSIPEVSAELSTLKRIRGMWEFAAFMQYLFFFGKAVKIDDLDVEDFEDECLKPGPSERLTQIALALLKNVSSHKGLTPELLDEYTRRQYVVKAPKRNPFGEDDEPKKFSDFDVFTKIRVLQQLATWTLNNPNPIREKLDERESEQVSWRIEPFGWDKEDRVYFVLDDNRLYRRTDAPPPANVVPRTPLKSKSKGKKNNGRNTRSAKRPRIGRRVIETSPEDTEDEPEQTNGADKQEPEMDDFCMQRWELIAVSMDEYNEFLDTIRKSRDPNERSLVKSIQEHVMPILLEAEEERKRKEVRRMKELQMLQKIATSKRSSRLADKQDKLKQEREAAEAEEQRRQELEMARKEQKRQQQMEEARESRRETREQRLREREVKRILEQERLEKEQELLQKMETDGVVIDAQRGRISERQLKADVEKRKQELESLQQDDSWYFDCVCGVHGQNLDDGSHSIACEKCSTWQHSKCNSISEQQAEREDFHFVCKDCKKKEENPVKIKLKVDSSPPANTSKPRVALSGRAPASGRSTTHPKTNGTKPLVYPGPPPAAPTQNGVRPNGAGPTAYQWHAYTPPQPIGRAQSHTAYQQSQSSQTQHSPTRTPTAANFNHQTIASYAQSHSPSRPPSAQVHSSAVNQPLSMSPRPDRQLLSPTQQQSRALPTPYQQISEQHSPSAQQQSHGMPSNTIPTLPTSGQPGSPSKRPVSSGFSTSIAPLPKPLPITNGTHQSTENQNKSSPYKASTVQGNQTITPAAQRSPLYPTLQPTTQGQAPFQTLPGYSPTKQPSPTIGSSPPQMLSAASPPVIVSPPAAASITHFSPPKAAASVSPVKHVSSPSHPPPASLGQVPNIIATSSRDTAFAPQAASALPPILPPAQPAPQKVQQPTEAPAAPLTASNGNQASEQ